MIRWSNSWSVYLNCIWIASIFHLESYYSKSRGELLWNYVSLSVKIRVTVSLSVKIQVTVSLSVKMRYWEQNVSLSVKMSYSKQNVSPSVKMNNIKQNISLSVKRFIFAVKVDGNYRNYFSLSVKMKVELHRN